jgi:hypothetical protein
MTTHDPLVIAGRVRQELRVMRRLENGVVDSIVPIDDPRGMGVSALLTSDVYGLRSELDPYTLRRVLRRNQLAHQERLGSAEVAELSEINAYLDSLGFQESRRDPMETAWIRFYSDLQADLGIEGSTLTARQSEELGRRMNELRLALVREGAP